jgi:exodeoxyribonuclease V alpha subunit
MTAEITLDPSQERAVDLICTAPVGIVTGGPGRGKTTVLRYALDRLDEEGTSYELAAPTGKASRRMFEATGREARTIHRLLEFRPGTGWQRDRFMPLDADLVVIDESSMIDVELGAALLDAIGPRTRLILIGDADQLPPVGPGRVFGDLVDAAAVPIVRLDTLHRSARESWIHLNAPRILAGEMPDLALRPDFKFIEIDIAPGVLSEVCRLVTDVFPREIDADVQVLIPQRPGLAGIDAANTALQNRINPRKSGDAYLPRDKHELRLGDRVIQTRNDYNIGIFNGEIGDVVDITSSGLLVQFEGRGVITYTLEQAGALQLAYALTVHRAQGSEFPWVIVVCHSTHSYILTRQLIYTAVTRGKRGVILVGDSKGLRTALSDKKPPPRNTALIERMKGELPA